MPRIVFRRSTTRLGLCGAVVLACLSQAALAETAAEVTVKAAVVHKIAKFVTWPESAFASADAPMRFCVAGNGGIFEALNRIGDRPVHGREVVVRRAPEPTSVVASCDVLYLTPDADRQAREWLDSVANAPVLTFGDAEAYGGTDSIVMLTIRRNKVRFVLNLEANTGTGLRISAQLLQLAAAVGGGA